MNEWLFARLSELIETVKAANPGETLPIISVLACVLYAVQHDRVKALAELTDRFMRQEEHWGNKL